MDFPGEQKIVSSCNHFTVAVSS